MAQNIPVTGIRGIAEALDHLQEVFQTPIAYEQLPLENPRKLQTEAPKLLFIDPATALIQISGASRNPYLAAQSVLTAYRNAAEPGVYGVYRVLQQSNQVNVFPIQVLAIDGSLRDVTPLMSRTISFPAAPRLLGDTVELIADALSKASGFKVLPIGLPGLPTEQAELGANRESAANVIAKLGARLNHPISFRCIYDPDARAYYVTLKSLRLLPHSGSPSP